MPYFCAKVKVLSKIIALDIGGKRTGIAETDELQIIASPRETVATDKLLDYLHKWLSHESVECIVLGDPINLHGGDSNNSARVREWVKKLKSAFPDVPVALQDERFTSKMAAEALVKSGVKKKKRQQKGSLDPISAAIILQEYLENKS